MTDTLTIEAGSLVLYHGSQRHMHGEWQIVGPCACHPDGWDLADIWERDRIACVRRESFTPYSEIPAAPTPAAHKTHTSQPSGYVQDADGTRHSDKRGRLMYDRSSYWFCTCGAKGFGADREEARMWARSHREQEAAREQAEYETALAALRAKFEAKAA